MLIPIPPKRNGYNNTRLGEQLLSSFLRTMNCPDSQYEPSMCWLIFSVMQTLRSSDCRKGRESSRARWLWAEKYLAMIFMRDRCSSFPGCPTEPASSGIREMEDSGSWHQQIPDCRKMIPSSAIISSTMNLLIFMAGNMEIGSQSLMP